MKFMGIGGSLAVVTQTERKQTAMTFENLCTTHVMMLLLDEEDINKMMKAITKRA